MELDVMDEFNPNITRFEKIFNEVWFHDEFGITEAARTPVLKVVHLLYNMWWITFKRMIHIQMIVTLYVAIHAQDVELIHFNIYVLNSLYSRICLTIRNLLLACTWRGFFELLLTTLKILQLQ